MTHETIRTSLDPRGVARLTLNRPERHNALSALMIHEIHEAITALGADPGVRVVVLDAEGESFCAGGDLGWMRDQMEADPETRAAEAGKLAHMLQALNACPKPLIGRVQGNAFGGGIGMMAVCDVAVGRIGARFALTETRLGLIPATIGPHVLARIGGARARRVFLSGRAFGAEEAVDLNLLARAVPEGDLDAALEEEIRPFLECAPGAVAEAKALLHALATRIDDSVIDLSIKALTTRWESDEARDGIAAFFAKEKPAWQGG